MSNGYTPTEERILEVLNDGHRHSREELVAVLPDEAANSLQMHISNIRKKMPVGYTIVCEYVSKKGMYRHVRLLSSANDGRI